MSSPPKKLRVNFTWSSGDINHKKTAAFDWFYQQPPKGPRLRRGHRLFTCPDHLYFRLSCSLSHASIVCSRLRCAALRFNRLWHPQKNKPQIPNAMAKHGNGFCAFKAANMQPVEIKQVQIKYTMFFMVFHLSKL